MFLDRDTAQVWDVRREAKRFVSASSLSESKEKVRADTLFNGFAKLCRWDSPSTEIGQGLHGSAVP